MILFCSLLVGNASDHRQSYPQREEVDTMMERSVYYNQFDGFTARSDSGREETDKYFQRLGLVDL